MIKLGEIQTLVADHETDHGMYLVEKNEKNDAECAVSKESNDSKESVLLPKSQYRKLKPDDRARVFVYKDSEDRLVATAAEPLITLKKVARLKVKEITKIGAFLDWGLSKDLLLPFREQTKKLSEGESVLVALYIDKSNRLCATMKLYHYLETGSSYKKDDRVEGTVYEVSGNFGTFIAVDDRYSALIPKNELFRPIPIGAKISCRVVKITDDGRLTLSTREKAFLQMDADARFVLMTLKSAGGTIELGDKSSPEDIKARFGLSKAAYKRAIGVLYKNHQIEIGDYRITLIDEEE